MVDQCIQRLLTLDKLFESALATFAGKGLCFPAFFFFSSFTRPECLLQCLAALAGVVEINIHYVFLASAATGKRVEAQLAASLNYTRLG